MPSKNLTQLEYRKSRGIKCPNCRSLGVEAGKVKITCTDTVHVEVSCNTCGATWEDVYNLKGYTKLQ